MKYTCTLHRHRHYLSISYHYTLFEITGMGFKLYQVNLFTKYWVHSMFSRLGASEKNNCSFNRAGLSLK